MIFSSDAVIASLIILVGLAFFTSSMVGHTDVYKDALKTSMLYDKASYQLKSLVSDGTIEICILLINNNKTKLAEDIVRNKIPYDNYQLIIGSYTINSTSLNISKNFAIASAVIIMNRTEGWYGIYGNNTKMQITDEYFMTYNESLENLNDNYNYPYKKPIYYFNSSNPIVVKFILYN